MSSAVVITGAAGALGRAVVSECVERGALVIALDLPGDQLDAVAAGAPRNAVHPVGADLADRESVTAAWEQVDRLVTPSALVALAGGFAGGSLAETDPDTLEEMLRVNFLSALWSCQAAAPRLSAAGGGSILLVGSRTARQGKAPIGHATSKAAVVRLAELLDEELRDSGVRVNAILPSVIDTPANRSWMPAKLAERAVPPAAIAKVIAFLCSDDAWPISGASIPVYGNA